MTDALVDATRALAQQVDALRFGAPVTHVYNPLVYAWAPHEAYLRRYGGGTGRVVWLGMNPGPYGMAQTGVPFGEVGLVRDWMGISGPVDRPDPEHPKRPILGFDLTRSEVSGARLWGWARDRFVRPEDFFSRFFVVNYCPLVFLEQSGRNFTPDKLPAAERDPLLDVCDRGLCSLLGLLAPRMVVGVGAWAEQCARRVLEGTDVPVGRVLHPSPASPAANRGWAEAAERQLREQGILT